MKEDIKQKETEGKGMFYIEKDGEIVSELTYTMNDNNVMTLDHSETEPAYTGKGFASGLVKYSVEYARKNDLKIDPLCDYAAHQFEKHKEYQEVQISEE